MKTTIATLSLLVSLLCAPITAADADAPAVAVEQQFQKADVQLAIAQYRKLRMSVFDITLRLQTELDLTDEQRKRLELTSAQLQDRAEELRAVTIKRAAVALGNGH